jgi:hypothetical protein
VGKEVRLPKVGCAARDRSI